MPEAECRCPPPAIEPRRLTPESQTAWLVLEKRAKGKIVTIVSALDPDGNDLAALAASLKTSCGTGGTLKDGRIELQGDHLQAVEKALQAIGYRTKRK
jgi:translation initiation factor 1